MRWLRSRWLHGEEQVMGRVGDGFVGGHGGTIVRRGKD
jgi:hypothetical protein